MEASTEENPDREAVRRRFAELPTSLVSDVLHDMGHRFQVLSTSLQPLGDRSLAGWAYPILGEMRPPARQGDPKKAEAISDMFPGAVSVWSGGRAEGVCMFGDLLALAMHTRGSTGAVVDGGVRDVKDIRELGLPVFSRYRTPNRSSGWWSVSAWQVPVFLPGALGREISVAPGDFVLGDDDGVVIVPSALVGSTLEAAEELFASEDATRADIASGMHLSEVLKKHGRI